MVILSFIGIGGHMAGNAGRHDFYRDARINVNIDWLIGIERGTMKSYNSRIVVNPEFRRFVWVSMIHKRVETFRY